MTIRLLGSLLAVLLAGAFVGCRSQVEPVEEGEVPNDPVVEQPDGTEESGDEGEGDSADAPDDDGDAPEDGSGEGSTKLPEVETSLPAYPGSSAAKFDPEQYAGASRVALLRTNDTPKQVYDHYKPMLERSSGALGENGAYLSGNYEGAIVSLTISTTDSGETEILIQEID